MSYCNTLIAAKDMVKSMISVCGTDCSVCSCFGNLCTGCTACEGNVFHSPGGCSIYQCVIHEKNWKTAANVKSRHVISGELPEIPNTLMKNLTKILLREYRRYGNCRKI